MSEKSRLVVGPAHDPGGSPPGGPPVRIGRDPTPGQVIASRGHPERWPGPAPEVRFEKRLITPWERVVGPVDVERRLAVEPGAAP